MRAGNSRNRKPRSGARPTRRRSGARGPALRIGIDTGGTFTDFVLFGGDEPRFLKVRSTPSDPARAVLEGLERLEANLASTTVIHGSTVATNALLERKGGPTALITTHGFEDLIEIGRQARPDLYDWNAERPGPLVRRTLRFGVRERVHADGSRTPPGREEIRRLKRLGESLRRRGVRSVAVCFLHSYRDGRHEKSVGRMFSRLGFPVTLSHELVPEFREYERFSTACANAFLQPVVGRYLADLESGIDGTLRVLQSSGLSAPAGRVAAEPAHAVLSGPAGGVIAALELSRRLKSPKVIAFDMGGTSTDVALIDGDLPFTVESHLAGTPVRVPAVAIESVGAGGGSIARVDAGGALRVGPESAGADPGPACYGRGTEPTVTDAHLLLGRLGADELLGGEMHVDPLRARRAIERLARQAAGIPGRRVVAETALRCAEGIINVANAGMERALRAVSMQRGHDPRQFALVCYGGAGGLHACELAEAVGIRRIIVPRSPGTFSARGMVLSPAGRDESQTVLLPADRLGRTRLGRLYRQLERRAGRTLTREGVSRRSVTFERLADLRYAGQSHEVTVPGGERLVPAFHAKYGRLFGHAREDSPVEVVTLRVRARERRPVGPVTRRRGVKRAPVRPSFTSAVIVDGRRIGCPAFLRERLPAGARISGPARILEYSSTVLLQEGWVATVDGDGNLHLEKRP